MDAKLRTARRITGIARFERECRKTRFGGRLMAAWRVPGTQEAGTHAMLMRAVEGWIRGHD